MTPEQIEELKSAVAAIRGACEEIEMLISDYGKCESELSKRYLAAAVKKHASGVKTSAERLPEVAA